MKQLNLTTISLILLPVFAFGQELKKPCDCPPNDYTHTKADTTFYLSNGRTINLCGYRNTDKQPVTFSEFVLAVCGRSRIIGFWGAVINCRIRTNKDTLFIDQIENFPVGKNFSNLDVVWSTEKIYFTGEIIVRDLKPNRLLPKYNESKIELILKECGNYKKETPDTIIENMIYELFIATISGSKEARVYFTNFQNKFKTFDGAYEEEYSDLKDKLNLWDTK